MYGEALRTPVILRFPNQVRGGQQAEEMGMNIDIASTRHDFAGIEIPKDIQGKWIYTLFRYRNNYEYRETKEK